MLVAVRIKSPKPLQISFDQFTVLELHNGEVYEVPEDYYERRKHLMDKLSDKEVAAMAKAADLADKNAGVVEPEVPPELKNVDGVKPEDVKASSDDSVQSAALTTQNRSVRKFSADEKKS